MRTAVMVFFGIYFFVVTTTGAPNDSITVPMSQQNDDPAEINPEEQLRLKSMEVAQPPAPNSGLSLREQAKHREDKPYYYPYKTSFTPRFGLVLDSEKLRDNSELVFLFGFVYMLPSNSEKHWEFAYDIHTGGIGYLQLSHRWVFTSTEKLRPYLRAGLTSRLKAEQGIASLVNKDNIQFRMGFGFEDLLINPLSAVVGMDLAFGSDQNFMAILLGYSWAW